MHHHDLQPWRHAHDFREDRSRAERNTRIVMLLTAVTMLAEIVAGSVFGSMALLADGWHMATHVAALLKGIPALVHVTVEVNPCPGEACLGVA